MINSSMARAFLPHCKPGTALDLLIQDVPYLPEINDAPSDDVLWARYNAKDLDLDDIVKLISLTKSSALLARIAKKDKRRKILRAVARNPAADEETAMRIYKEAHQNSDADTRIAIWESRSTQERLTICALYPRDRYALGRVNFDLAHSATAEGDEALAAIAAGVDADTFALILGSIATQRNLGKISATSYARHLAANIAETGDSDTWQRREATATLLIQETDSDDVRQQVLELLPMYTIVHRIIMTSPAGKLRIPQAELLKYVQTAELKNFVGSLALRQHKLDAVTVRRCLKEAEWLSVLREATFTSEAFDLLVEAEAKSDSDGLSISYLMVMINYIRHLDVPAIQGYLERYPDLAKIMRLDHSTLVELAEAGTPDEVMWELLEESLRSSSRPLSGILRSMILERGPGWAVHKIGLTIDELPTVLARPDIDAIISNVASYVLGRHKIADRETRRRLWASRLGNPDLHGPNAMDGDDLRWALQTKNVFNLDVLISDIQHVAAYSYGQYLWEATAAHIVPLPWASVRNATFIQEALQAAERAYGQDKTSWQTFLTLLQHWEGSLDDLMASIELL